MIRKPYHYYVLFLGLCACNPPQEPLNFGEGLNLSSPEGVLLASSYSELEALVREYGEVNPHENIRIINIDYLEGAVETAAFISWANENNERRDITATFMRGKSQLAGREVEANNWMISCNGPCGCRNEGEIRPDGTITVNCSCTTCTMTIKSVK